MDWTRIVSILTSYEAFVVYECIIIVAMVVCIIHFTKERKKRKQRREAEMEESKKRQLDQALNNVWR